MALVLSIGACSLRDLDYLSNGERARDSGAADANAIADGDGDASDAATPDPRFVNDARFISVSRETSCLVRASGTVFCWGTNAAGQLGRRVEDAPDKDGGPPASVRPLRIENLRNATQSTSADLSNCAVAGSSNLVWCWGASDFGALGRGPQGGAAPALEVQLPDGGLFDGVTALASLGNTHCALASGRALCWGENFRLHGGAPTGNDILNPFEVLPGDVEEIGVGFMHTCARMRDGKIRCWGDGRTDAFAGADAGVTATPTEIPLGARAVRQLAVGNNHNCVLEANDLVTCWGRSDEGQIGPPSVQKLRTIDFGAPIRKIVAGGGTGFDSGGNTCVVFMSGRVACIGRNNAGQLGIGSKDSSPHPTPTVIPELEGVSDLRLGARHACALLGSGQVKCWGENGSGQLGDGTREERLTPTLVVAPLGG